MGVGSSVNNNSRYHEPSPLPPPFYTGTYFTGQSRDSSTSEQSMQSLQTNDRRMRSSTSNAESWQHRPSAPSLSSLRQPHETLLTYAAQMTGWQTESTANTQSVHQEAMELTKTVAHLAAANQQLATAHTALIGQLERLYMKLHKEDVPGDTEEIHRSREHIDDNLKRRIECIESLIGIKLTSTMSTREREDSSTRQRDNIRNSDQEQMINEEHADNVRKEYAEAVQRIQTFESELETPNCTSDQEQFSNNVQWRIKNNPVQLDSAKQNVEDLSGEIARLQAEQLESREINRKLTIEVETQKKMVETIRRDYETSKNHSEQIEMHLKKRTLQFDRLMRDFNVAKLETSHLIEQLDVSNREKDITTNRVVHLETNLKRVNCTNEESATIASEENLRLHGRLNEEIKNKKKLSEALDESLREIRRLNGIIDTSKKSEQIGERVLDAETSTDEDTLVERPSLEEFKKDLSMKREARQRAIAAVSSEMDRLRRELDAEKEAHSETSKVLDLLKTQAEDASRKSEMLSVGTTMTIDVDDLKTQSDWNGQNSLQFDAQRLTDVLKVSDEMRACIRLQIEKIDDLRYHLECDQDANLHRISTLKNITDVNRETFGIREIQINKLKNVLSQIVARLGDEKFHVDVNDDLRTEHDRQVEDIKRLKSLYDERMRVLVDLKDSGARELTNVRDKLKCLTKEKEALDEEMKKSEEKIDTQDTEISNLESQLGLTKADCRDLQNQMSVINGLFSQMLLSASSADMDLDRLTQLIQENHDLISEMAREEGTEAAALPKLLLDLVEQVEGGREKIKSIDGECEKREDDQQEETIAHNLPKVWRVLLELLSCHAVGSTSSSSAFQASLSTDPNVCYKSVDTPSGPRLVISVSKTYIRLKELILEKKHLEKEMGRMKQLNSHLESKLGEQEKRLSTVSAELSKTWNIVGRMQAQHQQLHTHEKILRYELQQKRKMLQELKQELEYCREKWESARQKNTNTEMEWRNLRREFAARKAQTVHDSFNTSAESGFSDDRGDETDDECLPAEDRLRVGSRRRTRKESPRTPTSDTESEQPTDNELSESKTESTSTPEQRTPTPETKEMECDTSTMVDSDTDKQIGENLNPMDQALANVIENLIKIEDDTPSINSPHEKIISTDCSLSLTSEENVLHMGDCQQEGTSANGIRRVEPKLSNENTETNTNGNPIDIPLDTVRDSSEVNNPIPVFTIGPFPVDSEIALTKSVQFSDPLIVGPSPHIELPVFGMRDVSDPMTSVCSSTERSIAEPISSEGNGRSILTTKSDELPSTSISSTSSRNSRTPEEVLAARAARLKRLEEQADWLMKKMNATSRRGSELSTRLEELHEVYGEAPVPPPMPDVLPTLRLPIDAPQSTTNSEIDQNGQTIDPLIGDDKDEAGPPSETTP